MAPVSPFFADWLYRNLNNSTGKEPHASVHLALAPAYDPQREDKALEQRMDYAQRIASLALSLRKKEKIRVRQPLQKILLPVLDDAFIAQVDQVKDLILAEVNVKEMDYVTDASGLIHKRAKPNFKTLGKRLGKQMKAAADLIAAWGQDEIRQLEKTGRFVLEIEGIPCETTLEDYEILTEDIPGWQVATDNGITVALDITLSPELEAEGMARELVNRIQNIRKNRDFNVTDRIRIALQQHPAVDPAVQQFGAYICQETLADLLVLQKDLQKGELLDLPDDLQVWVEVALT
jgi:isoleucyl-tRNA synthetase